MGSGEIYFFGVGQFQIVYICVVFGQVLDQCCGQCWRVFVVVVFDNDYLGCVCLCKGMVDVLCDIDIQFDFKVVVYVIGFEVVDLMRGGCRKYLV